MKCIVCDNGIRIDSLKQLFALRPPLFCHRCAQNLIPKSADILYEDNEWIRAVIDRLNQGDIVLTRLFENSLQKVLTKKGVINSKIKIIEAKEDLPYPWLEILLDSIGFDSKEGALDGTGDFIVVAVCKQDNVSHQVAIIG